MQVVEESGREGSEEAERLAIQRGMLALPDLAFARWADSDGEDDGPLPEDVDWTAAFEETFECSGRQLLAAACPGVTTLGGLLAAVEAAALCVTQRLAPGAWCGALGCVNMAGCSEAELVAGRRRVVCGCCGVVSYCSPACLAADAAAGRLKHHRRLPGAKQAVASGTPGV
jgi:hypothetical protein